MSAPSPATLQLHPVHTDCDRCDQLVAEMNATFHAVHDFIVANRDQRALNDSYLGDLGRLIQAQVVAHRQLVRHQCGHADPKGR